MGFNNDGWGNEWVSIMMGGGNEWVSIMMGGVTSGYQ